MIFLRLLLLSLILLASSVGAASPERERSVKPLVFTKGKHSTTISGSIKGNHYVDYQMRAGAGQTITVRLKGSNGANFFNLLPPGSNDAAMAIGELNGNRFEGLLPDDGLYTIRVFLMRSAARRNETSGFKLSVALKGMPLEPVPAKVDALIPGTPFHAQTSVVCKPAYAATRQCDAFVIRRGYDGTATVELRWTNDNKETSIRRILFVKSVPVTADVHQPMTFTRDERGWMVTFNDDEHFEVPEPLVFGG